MPSHPGRYNRIFLDYNMKLQKNDRNTRNKNKWKMYEIEDKKYLLNINRFLWRIVKINKLGNMVIK